MIQAQGLSKSYGSLQVLKSIDVTIQKGEIVSIVGPSGAGKTTLLQLLGTLDKPDTCKVLINNTNVFALNAKELAAMRNKWIGFVFQFHHLLPEFTALENVCIPALIAGTPKAAAEKVATKVPTTSIAKDNLKTINGIGPKMESLLNEAGITTFVQLANASQESLAAILEAAGPRYNLFDTSTWNAQALEALAEAKK